MTNLQAARVQEKTPIASYAWVILAVVYFASVVAPFNQFKIPPIMPVLMQTFQIDLTQAGLLMSVIAMIALILALPTALMLQRFGHKTILITSLGFMALGSVIGAFSNSFLALLISRVVEGFGIGLVSVVAPAIIARWFPPERQGIPMGIWATWVPIGSVAIYNLSPRMASSLGWQSIWWVGAGFAVVMVVVAGLLVTQPPAPEQVERQDSLVLTLRQALANRNIWLLALAFTCMNLTMVSLATYYPTFLNVVRGYSLRQAAFLSSIPTLVILFSAPAAGWLSDRIDSRRLVFSLPFLGIAVLFLFPFRVIGWQIIALTVLQGLLVGAVPTATFAAAPEVMLKPEWAGLGLALVLLGQSLGQLVGPILFGAFVESSGWVIAGYLLIPFCLLGFLSGWLVKIR